jgi:hypothetical protein
MPILSSNPRILHDIQEEYQNGLGGRKPAWLLAYQQRVRV